MTWDFSAWDFFAGWMGGATFSIWIFPWLIDKWKTRSARRVSWRCVFLGHEWQLLWSQKDWDRAYLMPEEPVVFTEQCDQCGCKRVIPPPYLKAYPLDNRRP